MTFVDNHEPKTAQQDGPAGMVAQYRQVDHVGVGKQPAGALARKAAYLGGAVAVVGRGRDVVQPRDGRGQRVARRAAGRDRALSSATGTAPGRAGRSPAREDGKLVGQRFARTRYRYSPPRDGRRARAPRSQTWCDHGGADAAVGKRANHLGIGPRRPMTGSPAARVVARRHDAADAHPARCRRARRRAARRRNSAIRNLLVLSAPLPRRNPR